jgi:hypothetical protein
VGGGAWLAAVALADEEMAPESGAAVAPWAFGVVALADEAAASGSRVAAPEA